MLETGMILMFQLVMHFVNLKTDVIRQCPYIAYILCGKQIIHIQYFYFMINSVLIIILVVFTLCTADINVRD